MNRTATHRGLIFAIATMLISVSSATRAADTVAGLFQVVIGEVRVLDKSGMARFAVKGANIYEGDRVITGEGALAQVKFGDGGLMSIRANSEFLLEKFVYTGPNDEKPSIIMSLVKGGLRSITGLIGQKNRDGYRINTLTATIGIRGTDHEPMVILPPPPGEKAVDMPGTYDKVNDGRTYLQTPKGVVEILPRQVGFVSAADVTPRLLPRIPDFYRGDPPKQGATNTSPGRPGEHAQDRFADGKAGPRGMGPNAGPLAPMDRLAPPAGMAMGNMAPPPLSPTSLSSSAPPPPLVPLASTNSTSAPVLQPPPPPPAPLLAPVIK